MGKRIISFSLWGPHKLYNVGAIQNVAEANDFYPDWVCRFYVTEDSPAFSQLRQLNCEVVPMPREASYIPAYWRFFAASDPDVDYVVFRDCDSRVNPREKACVDEWIASEKNVHIMRDWPEPHATETVLAGMWGLRGGVVMDMEKQVRDWVSHDNIHNKYTDQDFLRKQLWPQINHSVCTHGYGGVPFPPHSPMRYGEYVGQPIQVE